MQTKRVRATPSQMGASQTALRWDEAPQGGVLRRVRVVRRGVLVLLFTLAACGVQALCLLVPGRARVVFARLYWASVCRLIGLRVRVVGTQVRRGSGGAGPGGRSVVFASNHSSWLDVLVLGGTLEACFVSKAEVDTWPVVKTVARLGRTVFVSRRARAVAGERDAMRSRLEAGDNLVLFPEGTSNDGSRVLPFRSTFFSIAEGERTPLIQPVSVVYDMLGGLPIGRASRAVFAWYGDMSLGSHFWQLAQNKGLRATVLLHAPMDPADYPSRKALAEAVWEVVAEGAATLRQNRLPVVRARAAAGEAAVSGPPAFA